MSKRRSKGLVDETFGVPEIKPKTEKQATYLKALRSETQIFAIGPAGTGKTWLPAAVAGDLLHNHQISKVVLARPNVPAGRSLGFFPGELEEKMAPWVAPLTATMIERMGQSHFDLCLKRKQIEIVPFETMRGRSFEDAFVLVDEAQNVSADEMYMILTRIGERSRLVISGDMKQQDIKGTSGLAKALDLIERKSLPVSVIRFTEDDIVRSGICAEWVKAWE